MNSPQPAWTAQAGGTEPYDRDLHRHPAVQGAMRVLSVLAGLAAAAAAFIVVGLCAALQGCEGAETTGLCVHHAGLVPVLELPIFVVAWVAPLAGGIASGVTGRGRWLGAGIAVALLMFAAMSLVSTGQTPYDFG